MATDASVEDNLIGGFWLITIKTKDFELAHRLYSKEWKLNIPKTVEATMLLDLVEIIIK